MNQYTSLALSQSKGQGGTFQYRKWFVSEPVLHAGPPGAVDDISVKDPTIVYYSGKHHLFYTSKASREAATKVNHLTKNRSGCMYVAAETLEGLKDAKRHDLGLIKNYAIVAPQVFYFELHKKWYLIAHTLVDGMPDLMPFYMTNDDISDANGWSDPVEIKTRKSHNGFWIDFWVICDDEKAHFFYTNHEGGIFRMECPVNDFPKGLERSREVTVLAERGETEIGPWRVHEAAHIYYVKNADEYLMLVEGVYPHPTIRGYWDSRTRFMLGYTAKRLDGPWKRVTDDPNEFCGEPAHLFFNHGIKCRYDQVSHFELIRSGYNSTLSKLGGGGRKKEESSVSWISQTKEESNAYTTDRNYDSSYPICASFQLSDLGYGPDFDDWGHSDAGQSDSGGGVADHGFAG